MGRVAASGRACWVLTAICACSLRAQGSVAQGSGRTNQPADRTLVVWFLGPMTRPSLTPPVVVPRRLKDAAEKAGWRIVPRPVQGRDIVRQFESARVRHDEPDVIFFTNMTSLIGIPDRFPGGPVEGLNARPDRRDLLVDASSAFTAPEDRGWAYLVRSAPHFATAAALATQPPACSTKRGRGADTGRVDEAFADLGTRAAKAYLNQDEATLDALAGGAYPADAMPIERANWKRLLDHDESVPNRKVLSVASCETWGNANFSLVSVTAAFTSEHEVGHRDFLALADMRDGRPVLRGLFFTSQPLATLLGEHWLPLSAGRAPDAPSAPILLKPADGATVVRLPPDDRPRLAWRAPPEAGHYQYLLEFQSRQNDRFEATLYWEPSIVMADPRASAAGVEVHGKMLFGSGRQDHRWRIWAINAFGQWSRSEWRLVHFSD